MSVIDVAVILAGWAFLLSSPRLRTTRTAIFLGVLTTAFASAGVAGAFGASIIRVALVWVYFLTFLRFQFWLAGLTRRDEHIDSRLRWAMRDVTRAHSRWIADYRRGDVLAARKARVATARACVSAIVALDELEPSSEQWRQALRLLRTYFVELGAVAEAADDQSVSVTGKRNHDALLTLNEQANSAWQAALNRPK